MTAATIRNRLIGAWSLVSYQERTVADDELRWPLGVDAAGLLLYTPDGYVSAQIMRRGRRPFAGGDWFDGTAQDLREASDYIAYSGTFAVDETTGILTHQMTLSFFPNWLGQVQTRSVTWQGEQLVLGTDTPLLSGGMMVWPRLLWQRAVAPGAGNSGAIRKEHEQCMDE